MLTTMSICHLILSHPRSRLGSDYRLQEASLDLQQLLLAIYAASDVVCMQVTKAFARLFDLAPLQIQYHPGE